MIQISMADANDFIESVTLGGTAYKLHFAWNDAAKRWTMDLLDNQNSPIVQGLLVVPNFPLFHQCHRNGLPDGELMAVVVNEDDDENQQIPRDGFTSGRFSLVFIPGSELNAIGLH